MITPQMASNEVSMILIKRCYHQLTAVFVSTNDETHQIAFLLILSLVYPTPQYQKHIQYYYKISISPSNTTTDIEDNILGIKYSLISPTTVTTTTDSIDEHAEYNPTNSNLFMITHSKDNHHSGDDTPNKIENSN